MKTYYCILSSLALVGHMHAKVLTLLTQEQFETDIKRPEKSAVVKFYADWCGPCQIAQEPFYTLATQSEFSDITFGQVNADKAPQLIEAYGITGLPTFLFFDKAGNQVRKKTGLLGASNASDFSEVLKKTLIKLFRTTDPQEISEPKPKEKTIWGSIQSTMSNLFEWIKKVFS